MKKLILFVSFFAFLYHFNINVQAATHEQEDVLYDNIEEPKNVIVLQNGNVLEYEDNILYKTNNTSVKIEGKLISCCDCNGIPYIVFINQDIIKLCKIVRNDVRVVVINQDFVINRFLTSWLEIEWLKKKKRQKDTGLNTSESKRFLSQ